MSGDRTIPCSDYVLFPVSTFRVVCCYVIQFMINFCSYNKWVCLISVKLGPILMGEYRLRMFEHRLPRRIYGPKTEEESIRRLEKLHNLYSLASTVVKYN